MSHAVLAVLALVLASWSCAADDETTTVDERRLADSDETTTEGDAQNASACAREYQPCDDVPCCPGLRVGIGKPGREEKSGFFCHLGDGFRGPAYAWEVCEDLKETYFGQTCAQWGSRTCELSLGLNSVCPVTCGHCTPGEMHWCSKATWRVLYPQL